MLTDDMCERITRAVALHREGKLPEPPPDFPWPQRLHLVGPAGHPGVGAMEEMTQVDEEDEKQAAIVTAFEELGSALAVSRHLQIPYETVRRRLRAADVTLTRGRLPGYRKKELKEPVKREEPRPIHKKIS